MSKTVEEGRRAAFRKIFANPPYEFSMARYTEDSTSWPGNYVSYHVECAWQAFNAALDAVEIHLPERDAKGSGSPDSEMGASLEQYEAVAYNFALADCRAAIEQTGLGLKVLP